MVRCRLPGASPAPSPPLLVCLIPCSAGLALVRDSAGAAANLVVGLGRVNDKPGILAADWLLLTLPCG